jgi:3-hydroxypropanoate dehydrogenase
MTARQALAPAALSQLFTDARSHHHWTDRKVPDDLLRTLYELVKWGPTSGNLQPARIVFVRSEDGRRTLYPALEGMGRNPEQVRSAPVTAIIAQDARFFDEAPRLFPRTNFKPMSENGARKRLISLGNQVRQPWRNSLSSFKVSPEFHQINGLTLTGACASR